MPRIDRRHTKWIATAGVLGVAATVVYVPYHLGAIDGPRGSSYRGLAFGIAAAALMLFEAALNLRKRVPTLAIGRAETWLQAHIWLGLLTVLLVFFHGGFRFGGWLTTLLMIVFLLMIASGVVGIVLQHTMPKFMRRYLRYETVYEQIPHVVERLRVDAYEVAASVCGADILPKGTWEREEVEAVQSDYRKARRGGGRRRPAREPAGESEPLLNLYREVQRYLASDDPKNPLADPDQAKSMVEGITQHLPEPLKPEAQRLGEIAHERRDLAMQSRLHGWLHGWLLLHVPLTAALFVLLGAHVWWAARYSTFRP